MKDLFDWEVSLNFFGNTRQNSKKAKIWILPVPYEGTVYNLSGTKEGPLAILLASRALEDFDEDLKKKFDDSKIFTLPFLAISKDSPQKTIERVKAIVLRIIKKNKIPIILGGEHSISFGAVSAFKKIFKKDFSVLQFDAHCDLREEFENTKYSHATVARRIVDDLKIKIVQIGVRSLTFEENKFLKNNSYVKTFFKRKYRANEIVKFLEKNVYLTIDLDVLDPSIMPAVGTPEPEGLLFEEVVELLKKVSKNKKIIGVDIVELSPIPGFFAPNYLAAKLVFKIINLIN